MYPHGSDLQEPITLCHPACLAADSESATALAPTDPDFRAELVERIRLEIANGTYETPEKWDIALDRLLDRLHLD